MGILDRIKGATRALEASGATITISSGNTRALIKPAAIQPRKPIPMNEVLGRGPRPGVGWSEDLERILALPRRPPFDIDGEEGEALSDLMTARLARPDSATRACRCRELGRIDRDGNTVHLRRLKPAQAWALYEAPLAEGLLGFIGVGHGKTLLDILMALVMPRCKVAVLLIPPGLVEQIKADYYAIREHFRVPSLICGRWGEIVAGAPVVHVVPYSQLSLTANTAIIKQRKPDVVLSDEGHRLRHPDGAGTGRIMRYFADEAEELEAMIEHQRGLAAAAPRGCRLCTWSGTLTGKGLEDYGHLSTIALGTGSPLPNDPATRTEWGTHLNAQQPGVPPAPPGELMRLCAPDETAEQGFNRRLRETRGVVTTRSSAVNASLYLRERKAPAIPEAIQQMLTGVRNSWVRPDGEELIDPMSVARCARELACGFYYRWRFPRTPDTEAGDLLIKSWFAARKAFMSELREKLKARAEHLDSEALCTNAAIRYHARGKTTHDSWCPKVRAAAPPTRPMSCSDIGCLGCNEDDEHEMEAPRDRSCACGVDRNPKLPIWESVHWPAWCEIMDAVYHETEAVWVDEYLAEDAAKWAKKHRGIVWYDKQAFGAKVADLSGLPLHGGGPEAETRIRAERGDKSIIASIKAHGEGRDGLQYLFTEQLVANPPSGGIAWEQLLGRLHRIGQSADEVGADVYRHTREMAEAIDKAVIQAKYIQGTLGTEQKLLAASVDWELHS